MLEKFFKEKSILLKSVKLLLLVLMIVNGFFSIGIMLAIRGDHSYVYDFLSLNRSTKVDADTGRPLDQQVAEIHDAVFKGLIEEFVLFLTLEFLGFFAILFSSASLVNLFASAYLMPNIRYSINLGFSANMNAVLLAFHLLKVLVALEGYHFACLVKSEGSAVDSVIGNESAARSTSRAARSTTNRSDNSRAWR